MILLCFLIDVCSVSDGQPVGQRRASRSGIVADAASLVLAETTVPAFTCNRT
jgi:hypothetical protein